MLASCIHFCMHAVCWLPIFLNFSKQPVVISKTHQTVYTFSMHVVCLPFVMQLHGMPLRHLTKITSAFIKTHAGFPACFVKDLTISPLKRRLRVTACLTALRISLQKLSSSMRGSSFLNHYIILHTSLKKAGLVMTKRAAPEDLQSRSARRKGTLNFSILAFT